MSRKWKITLGVLAVLIVFCLWYTRPRSFEELAGGRKAIFISMIAMESDPPAGISAWGMDSDESCREIIEILESSKYRASLIDLIPFLPAPNDTKQVNIDVTQDGDGFFWINCRGSVAVFHFDDKEAVYHLNGSVTEELFAYAREFGTKMESKQKSGVQVENKT